MSNLTLQPSILSIQQIERLTDQQLLQRIGERIAQVRSAFIEIGKLIVIWKVRHGDGAIKRLQTDLNLPKATLDNARHTARIWDQFVVGGYLTEDQFDRLRCGNWGQSFFIAFIVWIRGKKISDKDF